jgi:hypothetical protein
MRRLIYVLFVSVCLMLCGQTLTAAEWEQEFEVIEVDLGPTTGYPKHLAPTNNAALPLVIIYANGYDDSAPDSTSFECWTYYDTFYVAGNQQYFGVKIANYEPTQTKVTLDWEIIGPTKTIKVRQAKNLPAGRFTAYFIRRALPPVAPATYGIVTTLSSQGTQIHQMSSFFYIREIL